MQVDTFLSIVISNSSVEGGVASRSPVHTPQRTHLSLKPIYSLQIMCCLFYILSTFHELISSVQYRLFNSSQVANPMFSCIFLYPEKDTHLLKHQSVVYGIHCEVLLIQHAITLSFYLMLFPWRSPQGKKGRAGEDGSPGSKGQKVLAAQTQKYLSCSR